jgi:molybdenum cofactor sulfurtransferase
MTVVDDAAGPTAEAAALAAFHRAYPAFTATSLLDELRATEYARLDAMGQTYLDYTGGGLYAESQVQQHMALLNDNVFGNPHSENLTSLAMSERVEESRAHILRFFNASPDEYEVIFTPNATGALRLVGEAYPFEPGGRYLLTFDNHNSVNGIREFAKAKGAQVSYVPVAPPDLRVDHDQLLAQLHRVSGWRGVTKRIAGGLSGSRRGGHKLFAYPAQSNFSGVQHPLEWIAEAQALGWDVLLDAAAFAPTNRLDLGRWQPDFVALSFYKMFGYPTGIGCLIARKAALAKLQRPWYAGGTITFSSVQAANGRGRGFYRSPGIAAFEDGTLDYLSIPAIDIGLRHLSSIGMEMIHARVTCLTGWLLNELAALRHSNGAPMIRIYGPVDTRLRGASIALNFYDPAAQMIDSRLVEQHANQILLSLRRGCHCNPGAGEVALGISKAEMTGYFDNKDRLSYQEFLQAIDGRTAGVARISIGIASTFGDVYRFHQFANTFRDAPLRELTASGAGDDAAGAICVAPGLPPAYPAH